MLYGRMCGGRARGNLRNQRSNRIIEFDFRDVRIYKRREVME